MNEKLVAVLVRLKQRNNCEKTIAICFKVDENQIPQRVQSKNLDATNLVKVSIPGCKPFTSMVVVIAGKSLNRPKFFSLN